MELIQRDISHLEQLFEQHGRGREPAEAGMFSQNESVCPSNEVDEEDVPPDGGYGWVCVLCVFWINAHTWGINSVSSPCFVSLDQVD